MRSVRIESTIEGVDGVETPQPGASARRPGRFWRRAAAFLLGVTLGISGIVIGQQAFERHSELFGPADAPPPLRR
ncbi:hypothetical protein [uncultured Alsobacter sp.]|uniref:hypothetical protein n=1 Tax=uncultured Alsobacter sp. TaxID=1748258 RepID=UPI0025DEA19B|nr:hypothetical protein [uncultured Alsobacter sp.]